MASFPRSGNTFLRKYCELLTGVHTGSDFNIETDMALQMSGLPGSAIVDDKVWIVKTHSPWCVELSPKFDCNKALCILRNPLDSFISWLELC